MNDHATATSTTPPAATSGPQDDEAALRALLRQRVALFPALRRDDCPADTYAAYLAVCRRILFIQSRISVARYHAIKADVRFETDAAPPRAVDAPGEETTP